MSGSRSQSGRGSGPPRMSARSRQRLRVNRAFVVVCVAACSLSVLTLGVLLAAILVVGIPRIDGVYVGAVLGRAIVVEGPDGVSVQVPRNTVVQHDEAWRIETEDGETVLTRRSLAREEDGRYVVEDDWHGDVWFTAARIAAREPVYRTTLAGLESVDISAAQMEPRGLLRRLAEYTELGQFLTSVPSGTASRAGFLPALGGSMVACLVCALFGLPMGVGTAIFLEEFKPRGRALRFVHGFVEANIRNLAGVPSIVYGIIGLTAFVRFFDFGSPASPFLSIGSDADWYHVQVPFGRGVLAGGLTLMLVVLPVVIIATQEALRAVPNSLREGALAMGATRWQMVQTMTLPGAVPGIMTGSILAMSRAIGEAAPVLVIAGIVYITWTPSNLMDEFTVMPLQIYNWASRPQAEFQVVAAAGIIVLLAVLLGLNAVAVLVREKFSKPLQ